MFLLSLQLPPPPPTATRVSWFLGKSKKHGWTLAETLIALTIIGIIAAMTVPNLVSNFRKKQTETGIRVAYKILNDALKMPVVMGKAPNMSAMIIDSNTSNNNYYSMINYFATTYLVPYLKVAKTCDAGEGHDTCGIMVQSKQIDGNAMANSSLYNTNQKYRIQLTNGMQIGVGKYADDADDGFSFLVDINGNNGPNRMAYDQFYFVISAGECPAGRPQNKCARHNFIQGSLTYRCTTSEEDFEGDVQKCINNEDARDASKGVPCAALLQQNGWTIPDNYPVKKW